MDEVKRKIGGTQISRIFGLSRWGGPMDAYLSLTGIVEDNVDSEAAYWGKESQPAILRRYNKETGRNMAICDITYQHPQYEFITFTPDALQAELSPQWPESPHILEMKQTSIRDQYGEPGTDEVSDETALQCQLYMGCCGAKTCDVAVHFLRPRHEFAIFPLTFSQEIFDNIIEKASDFYYNHVVPRIPPPIDASEGSKKLLNHLYPMEKDDLILAGPSDDMESISKMLKQAEADRNNAVDQLTLLQNKMKNLLGDHAGVVTSAGKITWKKSKDREEVDWKAVSEILTSHIAGLLTDDEKAIQFRNQAMKQATTIRPGSRVFRTYFKKED